MSDVIRVWKDPAFRTTLSGAELERTADSPVGTVGEADLAAIVGGDHRPWTFHTCFSCYWGTWGCFTPGTCFAQSFECC